MTMPDNREPTPAEREWYRDLPFDRETCERMADALAERVRLAVESAAERDADCAALNDQLEGRALPRINPPWKGACDLEDTITREHHITTLAGIASAWRRNQFWLLESIDPVDDEPVRRVEQYINVRARQYGLAEALYDVAYNALTYRYAAMYVGWKTTYRFVRGAAWQNTETEEIYGRPPEDETMPVEQIIVRQKVIAENGPDFRAIDPTDFYLWPPEVQSVEDATACVERMRMTPDQMYEAFDRDSVTRVLRAGRDADTEIAEDALDDQGVVPAEGDDATIVLYRVIGRLPLLVDEDGPAVPEELMEQDYDWIIHLQSRTILRAEPLDYPLRPYVVFNTLRVPGRLLGHSIVSLLTPLHREATANLRFTIDTMNLTAAPAMKVPQQWSTLYGKWMMYPGALVPYISDPNEIQPLTWDMRGINAGLAMTEAIDARAARIASAQGLSSLMGGKVRKAAEVEATVGLVQMKSDLFFQNLQAGLERVGQLVLALYLQHMGDEGDIAGGATGPVAVKPDDLARRIRVTAYATSDDGDIRSRMERTLAARKVQTEYFAFMAQMPPYTWARQYHSAVRLLMDMGIRDVREWLGDRPPEIDPPWVAPQTASQQTAPALAGIGTGPVTGGEPVQYNTTEEEQTVGRP